jgi:RNA polymerase sigma-70 factor (ECF subfamily)
LHDEAGLLEKIQGGHIEYYRVLVERYQETALKIAYRFVADWESARDVVQESFLQAYESLEGFEISRPFSPWFYKIVVNKAIDRYRAERRRNRDNPLTGREHASEGSPAEDCDIAELHRAIERLPRKQKKAVVLRDLMGFTSAETAKILGCAENTVRAHLFKARKNLRKLLE